MLTDIEYVQKCLNGDSASFNQLVQRYQGKVERLVFKHVQNIETAKDLTQNVFFKVFKKLKYFEGNSKFSSWLFRIAVNESIDHIRAHKKKVEESLELAFENGFEIKDTSRNADVHLTHVQNMERKRIRQALVGLSPEMRSVIILKIYEEKTFDEISEILEIPKSTVKSRLYKALETLGRSYRRRTLIREVK